MAETLREDLGSELRPLEQRPLTIEQAHAALEAIYWSKWPDLTKANDDQVAKLRLQAAIEENQIPQNLVRVVESLGTRADSLGQRSISSPDFHLTLYLRRLSDKDLKAVPSLLHSQLKGYFGISIPLLADGSLDASEELIVNWHRQKSVEDALVVLPIVAARTAYSLGLPIQGIRTPTTSPAD